MSLYTQLFKFEKKMGHFIIIVYHRYGYAPSSSKFQTATAMFSFLLTPTSSFIIKTSTPLNCQPILDA